MEQLPPVKEDQPDGESCPEIIKGIKRVLEKSFSSIIENQKPELEGIEKIAEILNLSSRTVEKNVVESLEIKENGEIIVCRPDEIVD